MPEDDSLELDRKKLRAELSQDEGRRTRAYQDSLGIWTVGVGFNLEANAIPEDVVDRLLDLSIANVEAGLDAFEPHWRTLDADRRRVLVNMGFMGVQRLSGFRKMWAHLRSYLNTGTPLFLDQAAEEMLDSKWARQVGTRADRLAARMRANVPTGG